MTTVTTQYKVLLLGAILALALPFLVYAADPELEAQLRATLSQSAAQEGLSSAELDALVQELGNKASAAGITAETVSDASLAASPVAPPVQSGLPTTGGTESSMALGSGYLTIFTIVGLLLLGMVLVALWRKLEHKPEVVTPSEGQQPPAFS